MEKREFSSVRESKSEQVCFELLLKDVNAMYFPEVSGSELQSLGAVVGNPLSP